MAAANAFEQLIGRLNDQHRLFLREAAGVAFEALKAENRRLERELALFRPPVAPDPSLSILEHWAQPRPPVEALFTSEGRDNFVRLISEGPYISERTGDRDRARGDLVRPISPSCSAMGKKSSDGAKSGGSLNLRTPPAPPATSVAQAILPVVLQPGMLEEVDVQDLHDTKEEAPQNKVKLHHGLGSHHSLDSTLTSELRLGSSSNTGWVPAKERRRLKAFLGLNSYNEGVKADALCKVLQGRSAAFQLTVARVQRVLEELRRVSHHNAGDDGHHCEDRDDCKAPLSFDTFVNATTMPNLMDMVDEEVAQDVETVIKTLNLTTVSEVIDEATKCANELLEDRRRGASTWERALSNIVTTVTIVNVCTMGISIDVDSDNPTWFAIETICALIFVSEAALKIIVLGRREYFCGDLAYWNWLDFATTVISVLETIITVSVNYVAPNNGHHSQQVASTARVVVIMRILRMVRLVRMMLLQSLILRDLAKMLVGLVIGLPSLLWVLLLFLFVLYAVGLSFRICFGPSRGQELSSGCGPADLLTALDDDPVCKAHLLYGEEFFGTLTKSMFTTFRFMLTDYSSAAGNSIVVAFSAGYPWFDGVFVGFMVIVIFGFFNIITAIFVDTTTSGMKHNENKRKYVQQYERRYVKSKLHQLITRIQYLCNDLEQSDEICATPSIGSGSANPAKKVSEHDFELTQEDFVIIMEDHQVKALLADLDVQLVNAGNADLLFDTFDPEGDGIVTVPNFVQAVMKLRGQPQKNDVVASWVAVRSLHEKVKQFHMRTFEGQAKLEANLQWISRMLLTISTALPEDKEKASPAVALPLPAPSHKPE